MKRILNILFVILLGQSFLPAQSCYIQLDDASGFDTSPYLSELESAACALRDAFPVEFQNDFAVYDFGFYVYRPMYDQSLDNLFEEVVNQSLSHQYYLTFGRVINESSDIENIFVKVNLPNTDYFECTSILQLEVLHQQLAKLLKQNSVPSMVSSIVFLKSEINKMENCCLTGFKNQCSICLTSDQVGSLLSEDCFRIYNSNVSIDSALFQATNSKNTSILSGEDFWVVDFDGQLVSVADRMASYASDVSNFGLSFQGFVTSNGNTCSSIFENIRTDYENSNADVKIWWHINIEDEGNEGVIYEYADLDNFHQAIGESIVAHIAAENPPSNYGSCSGTNRFGFHDIHFTEGDWDASITKEEGILAHIIIQCYYRTLFPAWPVELEYKIPESSPNGGFGYADIVNFGFVKKEIFEIKTVYGHKNGDIEVERYVDKANTHCQPSPSLIKFDRGFSYPPGKVYLPWVTPNKLLVTYLHKSIKRGGVISYRFEPGLNNPSPNPSFVPQSKWEEIQELLINMTENLSTATELAWQFIYDNREMISLIIAGSATIFVLATAATTSSGGTTSLATVPLMVACGTLFIVCLDFDPNAPPPY